MNDRNKTFKISQTEEQGRTLLALVEESFLFWDNADDAIYDYLGYGRVINNEILL